MKRPDRTSAVNVDLEHDRCAEVTRASVKKSKLMPQGLEQVESCTEIPEVVDVLTRMDVIG
jgi:hypothetical protein